MSNAFIQTVYDSLLRDRLPRRLGVYDGIPVRDVAWLDTTDTVDPYKPGLKNAINDVVDGGTAVIVGSRGVSAVWLARRGIDVIAFEAAERMVSAAREAVSLQGLSDDVDIRHGVVGEAVDVFGNFDGADSIHPTELPDADYLILDCEGAERSILQAGEDLPPVVIVETHPELGASNEQSRQQLERAGYTVSFQEYHPDRERKQVLIGDSQ